MADNYVQQDRTFWRRSQQDSNTGGSVTSQKDSRWNPEFQLHEIEKLKHDIYGLLTILDETGHRQVASQILELNITRSHGHLGAAVGAIIETVLYYPAYTKLYARFCHILSSKTVELTSKKGNTAGIAGYPAPKHTFHDMMVSRTQEQFAGARAQFEELATDARSAKSPDHDKLWLDAKERLVTLSRFIADLYTSDAFVNSVMLSNFATIIYTSEQVVLQCLCCLMSAFVEKNKCSASHLKSVECYFEQLRQHYPTKLTAKYYRNYSYMRDGLDAVAASATTMTAVATLAPALAPADADVLPKTVPESEVLNLPASVHKSPDIPTTLKSSCPPDPALVIDFSSAKNKLTSSDDCHTNAVPAKKSWAIPLPSLVSKPDEPAIFNKLVDVYEMRQRNHQRLQELKDKFLCKDAGLTQPDFGNLPWMKKHATPSLLEKVNTMQTTVMKLVEDTEKSLQQHMREYYELVEKVTEDKIDELVESLPANSRADLNQKAYEASLSRLL